MTLAILNELRIRNGKTELKSWKESKAKLAERIEIEKAIAHSHHAAREQAELVKTLVNTKLNKIVDKTRADAKKVNSVEHGEVQARVVKEGKPQNVTEAGAKVLAKKNKVNVATIAKELGINPKVARAKLRKLNVNRADAAAIRKALTK